MADKVKVLLGKTIQLGEQVIQAAEDATSFRKSCAQLKLKVEALVALLRKAETTSRRLHERPTSRIADDTERTLRKSLALARKCNQRAPVMWVFVIFAASAFRKTAALLESSIGNFTWLLRIYGPLLLWNENFGPPPIAAKEPILYLIWEQIATLLNARMSDRSDAAAYLLSLAHKSDQYCKMIAEEGGVVPLLRLLEEGEPKGQENAAELIAVLGRDKESIKAVVRADVGSVFVKMLKQGPMNVQVAVARAVSEIAGSHTICQDLFAKYNMIRLLVSHLAFHTLQEHGKYAVITKSLSSFVEACRYSNADNSPDKVNPNYENEPQTSSQTPNKLAVRGLESKDGLMKHKMNAMAARALWQLAKGNLPICRSIIELSGLMFFSLLLEQGSVEVQYNCSMALVEITAAAEKVADFSTSAFKPSSPVFQSIVEQLLKFIEEDNQRLLIPSIMVVGNLARTIQLIETRMIKPLVRLLKMQGAEVSKEACIALIKFACTDNHLHLDHSKAIINAGGAHFLIGLLYSEAKLLHRPALVLLCYLAMHVPGSEKLEKTEVLNALEWSSRQSHLSQEARVQTLLKEARRRLELFLPIETIRELIAILRTGSMEGRCEAAASLVSLASDNDRYCRLIIEQGGVTPLVNLVKEGKLLEGQENALRAIGLLGRHQRTYYNDIVDDSLGWMFATILKHGPMKLQPVTVWAVSELAGHCKTCQLIFARYNVIHHLVCYLGLGTLSKPSSGRGTTLKSIHEIATGIRRLNAAEEFYANNPLHDKWPPLYGANKKGKEPEEDPAATDYRKAMAARALSQLAKGNSDICRSIAESRALLSLAVLLEKGTEQVRLNCALALMEITAVAEDDADLRRFAFKRTSRARKAVVDQILSVIVNEDPELRIPCVKALGNLARAFHASETPRIIRPLVKLLDEIQYEVTREATVTLTKFACTDNFLHHEHCKLIIEAGGTEHLVQLVYFAEQTVQIPALVLLCYIAIQVPESEEFVGAQLLRVLDWASKQRKFVVGTVEALLADAIVKLELYHTRGAAGGLQLPHLSLS